MAEFYATYDRDGHHFLAVVVAFERPASLSFGSRELLVESMESIGNEWQLISEVQLPDDYPEISATWLESMAERGRLKQLPKAHGSHVSSVGGFGIPPQ
jgi:hypothetical protein